MPHGNPLRVAAAALATFAALLLALAGQTGTSGVPGYSDSIAFEKDGDISSDTLVSNGAPPKCET